MVTSANIQAPRQFSGSAWKPISVVLPFLLLYWVNITHHTMFFDEVNAWAISAASPTLSKLFYYVHFEGHPWLWYFILWFPSRLTHDPVAMKWVEAVFGTTILLIVGLLSPFTLKQRALILCGYFLMWEYTVMCRMYSVMLLLVLLYVVRRVRKPEGVIGCCALLGLAGNTDMAGMLLASALLAEYAYSSYFGAAKEQRRDVVRRWTAGLLVYAALVGLAIATLWPSKDISWQSSGHLGSEAFNRHRIDASFGNMIASPWWPISSKFPHHFWETSVADTRWLYLLVPVVLFAYWKTFRRDRNFLALMCLTVVLGVVFADVVYVGRVRHWGITWVAFLVGLWLQAEGLGESRERRSWSPWTYSLLLISAVAGICAIVGSWLHPFSRAREAAVWIQRNEPADALIIGMPDVSFASLAEEMQRRVYFPECDCYDTFKLFSKEREDFDAPLIPLAINRAMNNIERSEILVSFYRPFTASELQRLQQADLAVKPVASFSGADMLTENYFLYRVRRGH